MKIERVHVLEIPFDRITNELAVAMVVDHLKNLKHAPLFIATPNPEMLLEARKNPEFKKILQTTDLNIPDGIGIIFASKIQGTSLLERVTGTDLMQKICQNVQLGTRIFLLGAAPGVAEKVKKKLTEDKTLTIVGAFSGTPASSHDKELQKIINDARPDILFVAFGAPKQELWLSRNLPHLPSVKIAMGVGGAFDFIAGIRKRAPRFMQKLGLEWLFRLIIEPSRWRRIYNATIKFPIIFLFSRKKRGL